MTSLERLFNPRAMAVIGATSKAARVGRIVFETLLRSGRPVYPVNPSETMILGHKAYNTVDALPDNIDMAVIAVNARRVVEVVEACAGRHIPFLIPVAGGFGETGREGSELEKRLQQIIKNSGSRILGPNTVGIFAPREKIDTIFVEHGDRALSLGGGVAFISQSGSVGVEALGIESNLGFGLRAFVGLGNKIDLDEVDFMNYFRTDDKTNCVALYVESLNNGRKFLEAAGNISKKKPIVVLKAGRSDAAAEAIISHTGKLSGTDMVVSGAFRQHGIQRVYDEEQLCDAARVLSTVHLPQGNRLAIMSPAGGYGVMAADDVETLDNGSPVAMAKLSDKTVSAIRSVTPVFASSHNPVDLTANATDDMTVEVLKLLLADDGVDIVLCIALFAPSMISDGLIRRIAEIVTDATKPVVVVTQFGPFTDGHISRFYANGVIGFPSVVRGVRAVRWLVERAQIKTRWEKVS